MNVSYGQLQRVRWEGSAAFRSLSFRFSIRWNWAEAGDYVRYVLGAFEVPEESIESLGDIAAAPPRYSLVTFPRARSGRFRLLEGKRVMASGDDPRGIFSFLAHYITIQTMRRTGDFFLIHAGAVVTPHGEGVLLPGASGSGKTSLTAGLVREGFGYLSDEAGAIDPVTRRLYPYPKALHLKAGVLDRFTDALTESRENIPGSGEWQVRPDALRSGAVAAGPCEPAFVIAPRYNRGAATSSVPMSPAETVAELGRNAWNLSVYGARGLELLADLGPKTRGWRLVFGDLDQGVAAVRNVCLRGDSGADRP